MRINIWIPDEDLELIDRARGEKSRSAFLVESARKVIDEIETPPIERTIREVKEVIDEDFESCKHGARKGLCKKGC